MAETFQKRLSALLLSHKRHQKRAAIMLMAAVLVVLGVNLVLRVKGEAKTREVQVLDCQYYGDGAHTHDDSCYDEDGVLVCPLQEKALHFHDDSCYASETYLVCGMEEGEGAHTHGESCYDEEGNLTCTLEESAGHQHTDSCWQTDTWLDCGQEEVTEVHVHGPACFKTVLVTVNDETQASGSEAGDPEGANANGSADSVSGSEDDATKMPVQEFRGELKALDQDGKEYVYLTVSVKAPEGAFAEGTTMRVKAIEASEMDAINEKVEKAVRDKAGEEAKATTFDAVDISFFDKDGKEVEPARKVEVKITTDSVKGIERPVMVHVDKDADKDATVVTGTAKVNADERDTTTGNEDTVKFDADKFSPYVIVEVEDADPEALAEPEPEAEPEAPAYPAQSFEGATDDVAVTVEAPEGAFAPGTTMTVEAIPAEDVIEQVEAAVQQEDAEVRVKQAVAVDIRFFDAEGNQVEPIVPVSVRMASQAVREIDDPVLVHVPDEAEAQVVEGVEVANSTSGTMVGDEDTLVFDSDQFSPYVIVELEVITTNFLSADGNTYKVTVEYGPEAQIPAGATLSVTEFGKNSDEYKAALPYLGKDAEVEGEEEPSFDVIDITILDKDGNKVEPADTVNVTIEMVSLPKDESADSICENITVHHLVETEQGIEAELILSGGAEVTEEQTVVAEFQVDSFSSFVIDWTQSGTNYCDITIYYVNQNGTQIQGPQTTQINITANSNNINLNTYTYNGTRIAPPTITTGGKTYTFGEARYGQWNGDTIQWIQTRVSGSTRYIFFRSGDQYSAANNPSTTALLQSGYQASSARYYWNSVDMIATTSRKTAKVYLVYTDNPAGDDPSGSGSGSGDAQNPLGTPEHNKTLTENKINGKWDGTYTLSLDVKGVVDESNEKTNADVLIILDTSSSMRGQSWTDAKRIILEAAQTLFSNNTGSNTRVRIALETFNNTAWKENSGNFYTTYSSFASGLNNLAESHTPGSSGVRFTNWEQALKVANDYTSKVRSNAEPYVIFVSDGNPTVRETKGTYYVQTPDNAASYDHNTNYDATINRWGYGVDFGTIPAATTIRCYTWARPYARQLVTSGWNFYAIGAWTNQMLRMEDLVDFAYTGFDRLSAPSGHAFNASNTTAVQRTFNNLVHEISKNFGYKDVSITDELSVSASTSLEVPGHATDFKYYKDGAVWSGAPAASYNATTRTVNWNLSSIGELGNSTYTVSFTVWPNQDAYDAMLELSQGVPLETVKQHYPDIADYITTAGGNYVFQANKNAVLTFTKVSTVNGQTTTEGPLTANYTFPTMTTLQHNMTVSKVWEDSLYTTNRLQSVTFQVYEDNEEYGNPFTLSESNNWTNTIPISPGIVSHQVLADGTRLNNGHVYTVRETAYVDSEGQPHTVASGDDGDYHYEFNPENVTPMLTDGVMTYVGDTNSDQGLSGVNTMRGSVTITKKVVNNDGTEIAPDEPFTIKVSLKDKNGNDIVEKTADDADAIFYRKSVDSESYSGPNYVINSGDTITLKAQEGIRLVNVPVGVQYKVEEITTGMPTGYEYVSTDYTYTDPTHTETTQTAGQGDFYVVSGNTFHYVTVTNKCLYTRIGIKKVDSTNTKNLNGAKFKLCADAEGTAAYDNDGVAFEEMTILNNDAVVFDKVKDGTYYLVETVAPAGYNASGPIKVTVSGGKVTQYEQPANSLSDSGEGINFIEDENLFILTILNSSGQELPQTGGPGTTIFTITGATVMLTAAVTYGITSRRGARKEVA